MQSISRLFDAALVLLLPGLGARRSIHLAGGQSIDAASQRRLGDYGRRVTIREKHAESARVGDAFNTMADALADRECELREAKEKAEDAAARMTRILERTTDSVIKVDRDWRISYSTSGRSGWSPKGVSSSA